MPAVTKRGEGHSWRDYSGRSRRTRTAPTGLPRAKRTKKAKPTKTAKPAKTSTGGKGATLTPTLMPCLPGGFLSE